MIAHFGRLGSKCVELETDERLRIFHDFYRVGEESSFHFDIKETRKKGHDFKDYICPDTMEFEKDYFKMGNRYGRVLCLRQTAPLPLQFPGSGLALNPPGTYHHPKTYGCCTFP